MNLDWGYPIGPAVGIAGVVVAVVLHLRGSRPKRLQYEVQTDQQVIPLNLESEWTDFTVQCGGCQLVAPRFVRVVVTNIGKVEARADDFHEPLGLATTSGDKIVMVRIVLKAAGSERTKELHPNVISPTEVAAPKTLINVGDSLEFKLLVEGANGPVQLYGRIAGFTLTRHQPRRYSIR